MQDVSRVGRNRSTTLHTPSPVHWAVLFDDLEVVFLELQHWAEEFK